MSRSGVESRPIRMYCFGRERTESYARILTKKVTFHFLLSPDLTPTLAPSRSLALPPFLLPPHPRSLALPPFLLPPDLTPSLPLPPSLSRVVPDRATGDIAFSDCGLVPLHGRDLRRATTTPTSLSLDPVARQHPHSQHSSEISGFRRERNDGGRGDGEDVATARMRRRRGRGGSENSSISLTISVFSPTV
ncbi:hypothetical protein LR48_Vigan08g008900 [Vigna angularis]|uniref:Uncharacterized protein n=1 Tax=Phaseolus angularis TaxID=3914 RepID=A0A0L9V2Y4_PHAAN|nr:hypothetical protein LR48_Vigan08g008900 [Vigna angularis]